MTPSDLDRWLDSEERARVLACVSPEWVMLEGVGEDRRRVEIHAASILVDLLALPQLHVAYLAKALAHECEREHVTGRGDPRDRVGAAANSLDVILHERRERRPGGISIPLARLLQGVSVAPHHRAHDFASPSILNLSQDEDPHVEFVPGERVLLAFYPDPSLDLPHWLLRRPVAFPCALDRPTLAPLLRANPFFVPKRLLAQRAGERGG
jgi:hypothetical protein